MVSDILALLCILTIKGQGERVEGRGVQRGSWQTSIECIGDNFRP